MTITIRDADDEEAAFINLVVQEASPYDSHRTASTGITHEVAGPERLIVRIAFTDGQLNGFHRLKCSPPPDGNQFELDYLLVHEQWRGRGIGRALFDDMRYVAAMLGQPAFRIAAHPPIESFYRRLGARRIGTQPADSQVQWTRPVFEVVCIQPAPRASVC